MSEKCLHCGTQITQTPGKREKKFCKPSCCTMFSIAKKKLENGVEKKKSGRPAGAKNKATKQTQLTDNQSEKELNKDEVGDKGFTMVNIPEITFENMGIRDLATKADKQSKKSSKKDTPVPSDPNNPTSLADMFKGRNINQRTYKHPKS